MRKAFDSAYYSKYDCNTGGVCEYCGKTFISAQCKNRHKKRFHDKDMVRY